MSYLDLKETIVVPKTIKGQRVSFVKNTIGDKCLLCYFFPNFVLLNFLIKLP